MIYVSFLQSYMEGIGFFVYPNHNVGSLFGAVMIEAWIG